MEKITLSVIKADTGGYVGHSSIHEALIEAAKEKLSEAKKNGTILDLNVTHCRDDLEINIKIQDVDRKSDGEIAAVASTQRRSLIETIAHLGKTIIHWGKVFMEM